VGGEVLMEFESREEAIRLAAEARDIGESLRAAVTALIYVGDATRSAAGVNVDARVTLPDEQVDQAEGPAPDQEGHMQFGAVWSGSPRELRKFKARIAEDVRALVAEGAWRRVGEMKTERHPQGTYVYFDLEKVEA
jgi:hypothetical protein